MRRDVFDARDGSGRALLRVWPPAGDLEPAVRMWCGVLDAEPDERGDEVAVLLDCGDVVWTMGFDEAVGALELLDCAVRDARAARDRFGPSEPDPDLERDLVWERRMGWLPSDWNDDGPDWDDDREGAGS
jgi:hypothetical protein